MTNPSRRDVLKASAAAFDTAVATPLKADFEPIRTLPVIATRTVSTLSDYKQRAIAD